MKITRNTLWRTWIGSLAMAGFVFTGGAALADCGACGDAHKEHEQAGDAERPQGEIGGADDPQDEFQQNEGLGQGDEERFQGGPAYRGQDIEDDAARQAQQDEAPLEERLAESKRRHAMREQMKQRGGVAGALKRAYQRDPALRNAAIEVKAEDDGEELILEGKVDNALAKDRAEELAESMMGVEDVENEIEVDAPDVPDEELKANVLQAARHELGSALPQDLEIEANDGHIDLKGQVASYAHKKLLVDAAKGVRGVEEVDDHLDLEVAEDIADEQIKAGVEQALQDARYVQAPTIFVKVDDGQVELEGHVRCLSEWRQAQELAWGPGVKSVEAEELKVDWERCQDLMEKHAQESGSVPAGYGEEREGQQPKIGIEGEGQTEPQGEPQSEMDGEEPFFPEGGEELEPERGTTTPYLQQDPAERDEAAGDLPALDDDERIEAEQGFGEDEPLPPEEGELEPMNQDQDPEWGDEPAWGEEPIEAPQQGQGLEPEQLQESVKRVFDRDPRLADAEIEVEAEEQGTVTLSGEVKTLRLKQLAEQRAQDVRGVRTIQNELEVEGGQALEETTFQEQATTAYSRSAILNDDDIQVDVDENKVTLKGTVDSEYERKTAERVIAGMPGVAEVENELEVGEEAPEPEFESAKELQESIESELFWSPFVDSDDVTVEVTEDMTVRLTGTVDDWGDMDDVLENVQEGGFEGMTLDNQIRVLKPQGD